jgi:deoxycytidine triphosphate deaminase
MIINDVELRGLLSSMDVVTGDAQRPFRPEDQIQPCSIDLRLDGSFWEPRKPRFHHRIDFRRPAMGNLEEKIFYQRRTLKNGEGITLKPGQLLLGRTFEEFTIPNGYAGKLEGRSTFARLGLSVHCTGDFINPGWRGRMPLQLVNHGRFPLILTPFLPLVQLIVMRVSEPSAQPYGAAHLGSKYMNDEGDPSRYWLDARIKKLQLACGQVNVSDQVKRDLATKVGVHDPDLLDRFLAFLSSLQSHEVTSAAEILERFGEVDRGRHKRQRQVHTFFKWLPFALFTVSLGSAFKHPYGGIHYGLWALTVAMLMPGFWYLFQAEPPAEPFSPGEGPH